MIHLIVAAGLLLMIAPGDSLTETSPGSETSRVEVTVTPVRVEEGGRLLVALFRDEESWLDFEKALEFRALPVESDTMNVFFEAVPRGEYAVEVLHDKNGNGKLDMRRFPYPKPKEGVGVSNNHRRMGKPRYSDALFPVEADTVSIHIELVY